MTLNDAVYEVMSDTTLRLRYTQGLSAVDVLTEIRERRPGAFPLVSVIDVADELQTLYG